MFIFHPQLFSGILLVLWRPFSLGKNTVATCLETNPSEKNRYKPVFPVQSYMFLFCHRYSSKFRGRQSDNGGTFWA